MPRRAPHGELAAGLGRCDELSLPPEFQPLFRSTTSTQPFGSPLPSIHHRVDGSLSFHPPRREGPQNPHEIGGIGGGVCTTLPGAGARSRSQNNLMTT
jgi:hypothetical protein